MKRYNKIDKKLNDEIHRDNVDTMRANIDPENDDMDTEPFQSVTDTIKKMARCLEDIAEVQGIDSSIVLSLMSAIPLNIIQNRHNGGTFKTLYKYSLDTSRVDPGLIMRCVAAMLIEHESDGVDLPSSVEIKLVKVKGDDIVADLDTILKEEGFEEVESKKVH